MFLLIPFLVLLFSFNGIDGFLLDGDIKGIEYNELQQCMTKYSSTYQQELSDCMAKGNTSDPDLCSITLTAFNCNLDLIRKTCPSREQFYQTYNYRIVKTCNTTIDKPGNQFPAGTLASQGNRITESFSLISLISAVSFAIRMLE